MTIRSWKVEIQPSCAPIWKSGIRSTTGGMTIREMITARRVDLPGKSQFAKPQAAKAAIAIVRMTDAPVTMTLLVNHVGNCADQTRLKPASVGERGRPNGERRKSACVLNAPVNIT